MERLPKCGNDGEGYRLKKVPKILSYECLKLNNKVIYTVTVLFKRHCTYVILNFLLRNIELGRQSLRLKISSSKYYMACSDFKMNFMQ